MNFISVAIVKSFNVLKWSCLCLLGGVGCWSSFAEESTVESFLRLESLRDIAARNSQAELYRLTVSRAFEPVLVFEIEGQAIFLQKVRVIEERKESLIDASYRLVRHSRLPIDPEEYKSFQTLLEAGSFWNLPSGDWQTLGLDGSRWILEGIKGGKYHRVERSSPFQQLPGSPLAEDLQSLSRERIFAEGRLTALFAYMWALSGEANEMLY